MRTGRPTKPIALKRLEGDTRQRGANKHAESLANAWEARRGEPSMPSCLRSRKDEDSKVKALLKTAREYWVYIVPLMRDDALLAELDQGMLVGCVLAYAGMTEAGRIGDFKNQARLSAVYGQFCDRMGLNESSRGKMSRSKKPDGAVTQQSKMAAFLKQRKGVA